MKSVVQSEKKLRTTYSKYIQDIPHFELDHEWLRQQDPFLSVLASAEQKFDYIDYYLSKQKDGEFLSPNPFFDWKLYASRSNFVQREGEPPIEYDFLNYGLEHNITPHWIFRNEHFTGLNAYSEADVAAIRANYENFYYAYLSNIEHFDRTSPLFSATYYRINTNQPKLTNKAAVRDYLTRGHMEGDHGTPLFDDAWYRARYEDHLLSVGREPHHKYRSAIQHFLVEGVGHGFAPIPDFDAEYYLRTYPDVREGINRGFFQSAIDHFLSDLSAIYRRPNPYFDPIYYLDEYPNARREMEQMGLIHPLEHFLHAGYKRGYRASRPLVEVSIPENFAKSMFERRQQLTTHQYLTGPHKVDFTVEAPDISVVIPVCDQFNFTASLLVQLAAEYGPQSRLKAQVIVVDNGSKDRTLDLTKLFDGVTYVRTEEPVGYTMACNLGAARARAPVVVFLNNDIELGQGSLEALVEELQDDSIGVVGGKIVLPDGTVQEAGGILFANGGTAGFARGISPDRDIVNIARDVDFVSGCLLAIRTELFRQIGGFDELFSPGYFEDTDLCLRVWEAGKRVRYLPHAYITHYEYGTYSKGRPKEISYFRMFANKAKFIQKHRKSLVKSGGSTQNPDQSASAYRLGGKSKPFVLFIEDLVPTQLFGSGFARSEDVMNEFLNRGWRVTVLAGSKRPGDQQFIDQYRGRVDVRFASQISIHDLLKEIGGALDLIWACRTHNLAQLRLPLVAWRRDAPGRRLVADTEALASLRTAFPSKSPSEIQADPRAVNVVRQELSSGLEFDEVVCVNEHEADLADKALEGMKVKVLGHRLGAVRDVPGYGARKDLVFCGAVHEAYSPNMDSLRWFCGEILPLVRKELKDVKLTIVGYMRDSLELPKMITQNATVLGQVKDLEPVFDQHRVFIAPTRLAAGMPHKVQQSMALGLPCVITSNLAEQLEAPKGVQPFLSAAIDPAAFAAKCVELYTSESLWKKVQAEAWTEIDRSCSAEVFSAQFDAILESIHADRSQDVA